MPCAGALLGVGVVDDPSWGRGAATITWLGRGVIALKLAGWKDALVSGCGPRALLR